MTLTILLFTLGVVSAANLRAERALLDSREHYRSSPRARATRSSRPTSTARSCSRARPPDRCSDAMQAGLLGRGPARARARGASRPNVLRAIRGTSSGRERVSDRAEHRESRAGSRPIRTAVIRDVSIAGAPRPRSRSRVSARTARPRWRARADEREASRTR
jgi:hypothetical protein